MSAAGHLVLSCADTGYVGNRKGRHLPTSDEAAPVLVRLHITPIFPNAQGHNPEARALGILISRRKAGSIRLYAVLYRYCLVIRITPDQIGISIDPIRVNDKAGEIPAASRLPGSAESLILAA